MTLKAVGAESVTSLVKQAGASAVEAKAVNGSGGGGATWASDDA